MSPSNKPISILVMTRVPITAMIINQSILYIYIYIITPRLGLIGSLGLQET